MKHTSSPELKSCETSEFCRHITDQALEKSAAEGYKKIIYHAEIITLPSNLRFSASCRVSLKLGTAEIKIYGDSPEEATKKLKSLLTKNGTYQTQLS